MNPSAPAAAPDSTARARYNGWTLAFVVWILCKCLALLVSGVLDVLGWAAPLSDPSTVPYMGFAPILDEPWGWLLGMWQRLDTMRYLDIAARGYQPDNGSMAFAPLYPLAIRWLAPLLGGNLLVTGLVISNAGMIVAIRLLYEAALTEYGATISLRSVLMFATFPTAYYLQAAYTEAPCVALILASFAHARRSHWGWASLLGCLAVLTRVQALCITVPLVFEYARQCAVGRQPWSVRRALPVLCVPGALFVFYAWARIKGLPSNVEATRTHFGQIILVRSLACRTRCCGRCLSTWPSNSASNRTNGCRG